MKNNQCKTCRIITTDKHAHYSIAVSQEGKHYGYYQNTGNIVGDMANATPYSESTAKTLVREFFERNNDITAEVIKR